MTFQITTPVADVSEERIGGWDAGVEAQTTSRKLRVLVADDNVDAADIIAILLQLEGYHVACEHSGDAALAKFATFQPHAALLDIGMPCLSGYGVARRIWASADGDTVLLVAITGWGTHKDRADATAAGFNHRMVKPPDCDVLRQWIGPARPTP